MIAATSSKQTSPLIVLVPMLLAFVAGCGESPYPYPATMTYPLRSDMLVLKPSKLEDFYADPPGHLDKSIADMIDRAKKEGDPIEVLDPKTVDADKRQQLIAALNEVFGTPAAPTLAVKADHPDKAEIETAIKEILAVDDIASVNVRLAAGSKVYRRQCLQCHGVTGDGRGPTGAWVNPHPRDYRRGEFKFISSVLGGGKPRKPRREDLVRILHKGIEGTSMPSFALLPVQDFEDVIGYVMHLSIRGQIEFEVMSKLLKQESLLGLDGEEAETGTVATTVPGLLKEIIANQWGASNKKYIEPKPPKTKLDDEVQVTGAVRRGYDLFVSNNSNFPCIGCHKDFGRQVNFSYDKWGTRVRPNNLTLGVYRGGRRPIDLFWRIRGGIAPSNMSGIAEVINDDQIWDVVSFLQALPYPAMLPEDIRHKIYGAPPTIGGPPDDAHMKAH